ncbi:MAG TPA: hypothetical protein VGB24_01445 [Longimicrobium sp.]|uniref:hypothetical protein n=1 Tax=Longimicrobium sp. TaxID=2029185 RepID=UPI002ED8D581
MIAMLRNLLRPDLATPPAPEPPGEAPPAAASVEELTEQLREMATSRASFVCARHGTEAGSVKFLRRVSGTSELTIDSYVGRSWHSVRVPTDDATAGDRVAEGVQDALRTADAISLHLLNPEWTPFFCTSCALVYCDQCWAIAENDDPWPGTLRGICPEGHATVLTR